jgi:NAD(P)-dependent dehydrogenase (short-subunit alcohol dehydrogenase family)
MKVRHGMLNGKIALVTGSTDGVGRAVAERLGKAGDHVLVHGRDRDRGEGAARRVPGRRAITGMSCASPSIT